MRTEDRIGTQVKPMVDWVAARIGDPVERLKFLQMVHPLRSPRKRSAGWRKWSAAAAALVLAAAAVLVLFHTSTKVKAVAPVPAPTVTIRNPPTSKVWLVDKSAESENYSNGLRVDTRFEGPNHRRSYLVFPISRPDDGTAVHRDQPAGIVFHTTESRQLPFEPSANGALKRIGESLVDYVRRRQAYHYLIDRFGRVYRLVPETDAANHAGYSVWADDQWFYLNLNESFLGVSFEAETQPGQSEMTVSPAQIRSAAILTEMLRDRYAIPAGNCVTHAQVSVNPRNMRVGYHTDWASSFPFRELGLPDNYARPLPAVQSFGFQFDETFEHWAGTRLYAGVALAEQELSRNATDSGRSLPSLRKLLEARYLRRLAEVRGAGAVSDDSEGADTGH